MTFGIGRDDIGFIIELVRGGGKNVWELFCNDSAVFALLWIFYFLFSLGDFSRAPRSEVRAGDSRCAVVLTSDSTAAGV